MASCECERPLIPNLDLWYGHCHRCGNDAAERVLQPKGYTPEEIENMEYFTTQEEQHYNGRMAVCTYGHKPVPSSPNLALFQAHPERRNDEYYCGCFGWD